MEYLVVIIYFISLLFIFLFSLGQLHLTWHYLRKKNNGPSLPSDQIGEVNLPKVTVQLPIYNELYVVERLLDAVTSIEYPSEKLEIQVLDDSTDETSSLIENKINQLEYKKLEIKHIKRQDRENYKAGALQHGLAEAKGDLIAIFDADFLPEKDFLFKTVMHFKDPKLGVVQTRWGHLNNDYSILTKLQAFGLDAHFSIEQKGRNKAGSFINFNGTGGVWRKDCIIDAGGWSADTLTEDLDLSYRAQLKGWKFRYLEEVVTPAELPILMPAIKSQQFRWNKGAAETARKNLGKVLGSKISFSNKFHAFFHLLNSSVFVFLLIAALLSIPMLFIKNTHPFVSSLFYTGSVFLIGFFSIAVFYYVATKQFHPKNTLLYFLKTFPLFLTFSMGLALHNSFAVLEGIFGFKSPFIRTPKFNITSKSDSWKGNKYIQLKISPLTLAEGVLCLYFIFGVVAGFILQDYGLIIFHLMLALGFASVFFFSLRPINYA
ncbi:glycosyltransferase family 2 protein [soil metagenome]